MYSPVKRITPAIIEDTMNQVMRPMAKAMVEEGHSFTGFLYGGLMLTDDGVKTIEFNARFGDPEAEVILPRLKTDFISVIQAVMNHQEIPLEWDEQVTLGVVMASTDYPASSTTVSYTHLQYSVFLYMVLGNLSKLKIVKNP